MGARTLFVVFYAAVGARLVLGHLVDTERHTDFAFAGNFNCPDLASYSIMKDSEENWVQNLTIEELQQKMTGLVQDASKKPETKLGYALLVSTIPVMSDKNYLGLAQKWGKLYAEHMKNKTAYGSIYVSCDAKMNTQGEPGGGAATAAAQGNCNRILHFFRIGMESAGMDQGIQKFFVFYGRHGKVYDAKYNKQNLEKAITDEKKQTKPDNWKPHEYGWDWGASSSISIMMNVSLEGAFVYWSGGNVMDLQALNAAMRHGDPNPRFKDGVAKFNKVFTKIVGLWRSADLMIGGHSAGVMWHSPRGSLNYLYFGLTTDANTGTNGYTSPCKDGGNKCEAGNFSTWRGGSDGNAQPLGDDRKPKPGSHPCQMMGFFINESAFECPQSASYSCEELGKLKVGGTPVAPGCEGLSPDMFTEETVNGKKYTRIKPSTGSSKNTDIKGGWTPEWPESFEGVYDNTNGLFPWAWRPHCCHNDRGKVKDVYVDNSGYVMKMYRDSGYKDEKFPILFSTDGEAWIVTPDSASHFDALNEYGDKQLCALTPGEECPTSWPHSLQQEEGTEEAAADAEYYEYA